MSGFRFLNTLDLEKDKEELRNILSGTEYEAYRTVGKEARSWLARAWEYVLRKLGELLPDHAVPRSAADFVSYLVILAGVALLVYLLVWLGRRLQTESRLSRKLGLTREELQLTYRDYWRRAEAAGTTRDYREGVRNAFLCLLFYSDAQGWLKVEQWKSNGEYAMELRAKKPEVLTRFTLAAQSFDQVEYGKKIPDAELLNLVMESVGRLLYGEGERSANASTS